MPSGINRIYLIGLSTLLYILIFTGIKRVGLSRENVKKTVLLTVINFS